MFLTIIEGVPTPPQSKYCKKIGKTSHLSALIKQSKITLEIASLTSKNALSRGFQKTPCVSESGNSSTFSGCSKFQNLQNFYKNTNFGQPTPNLLK